MKNGAPRNDMLDRLAGDPEFAVPLDDLRSTLDARRFIGRAAVQVMEFLREVVEPLVGASSESSEAEVLRV